MIERLSRLLKAAQRFPVGRPRSGLLARLAEVVDGLVPRLTAERVMGEALHVIREPFWIGAFDGADDAGMQGLSPVLEQGTVSDFMGEGMLEGVFGLRKKARLVQKFGRL